MASGITRLEFVSSLSFGQRVIKQNNAPGQEEEMDEPVIFRHRCSGGKQRISQLVDHLVMALVSQLSQVRLSIGWKSKNATLFLPSLETPMTLKKEGPPPLLSALPPPSHLIGVNKLRASVGRPNKRQNIDEMQTKSLSRSVGRTVGGQSP